MTQNPQPAGEKIDPRALRQALGAFATGITVITARGADGQQAGVTVNSFASVSLDPPLVLWSLGANSPSLAVFASCSHYAVNVLAVDQQSLSQHFATSHNDKFSGQETTSGNGGAALLTGCCAWFECRVVARHPGGDHVILIGEVERFRCEEKPPLIFYRSGYRELR